MKLVLNILFFLVLAFKLQAQQFIVKSYDYNNGLISGANHFTMQDSVGFYWICSYGGLVRFDGSTFKPFNNADGLVHYDVSHMYEHQKNDFIICNQFTLFRFDGKKFSAFKNNLKEKCKFNNVVRLNTQLICNTDKGVFQIVKNDQLEPFLFEHHRDKSVFQTGSIYFIISQDNELYRVEKNATNLLATLPKDVQVNDISLIQDIPYLISSNGAFKIIQGNLVSATANEHKMYSIYCDKKSRIWFTDSQHQLWIKSEKCLTNLTAAYKTKEVIEPQFMEDRNGNMVITSLYGITLYKEIFCDEIIVDEINNTDFNYISGIFGKDTINVGINQEGLIAITDHRKIIIPCKSSGIDFQGKTYRCDITNLPDAQSRLIRISQKGIFVYKKGMLFPYCSVDLDYSALNGGYYDAVTQCYFVGNDNGVLYKISSDRIDSFKCPTSKGLIINSLQHLPNGSLLFSGTHEKLFLFSNHHIEDITSQLKTNSSTFSAFVNKNKLWIVVHGVEIQEYSIEENSVKFIRSISKQQGLTDANIASISFDEFDNLWLNTFSGVYFIKNPIGHDVYSKKIYLQQGATDAPMINNILFTNGHLFATGVGGIMKIKVEDVLQELPSYKTYFSVIKVNNMGLDVLASKGIVRIKDDVYQFPTNYNSIFFQCNAVYFGFDDAIRFQYKLNDEEWKTLFGTNAIQYNDLGSGTYTLQVKTVNKLNPALSTEATFKFVVQPPYWKTWWFRGLLVLVSVSCIYGFIKRRDSIKEKENKWALQMSELKLTALQSQMNPHFIFNSMNSIQNYIMQQKPIEAARYLSKFSLLMRRILDQSFDNVAPLSEIVATLNMYLELESYRFNHGFEWHIDINENVQTEKIKLPAMLLQPFVENAIIHGLMPKQGDKKLHIIFEEKENCLYCVIDDNGVGVKENLLKDKTHVSRGQKLIFDMLETMKEVLQTNPIIETIHKKDDNGQSLGTTISIAIPINRTKL